jgi:hypothetical protein
MPAGGNHFSGFGLLYNAARVNPTELIIGDD